jgi:dehydrogenase/reductase SDR family protein 12
MSSESSTALSRSLDAALEVTIVGSFTRWGLLARRRLFDWDADKPRDLTDKVMIVTGATSGLGLATATELGRRGASVVLVGRNPSKTEAAAGRIVAETGNHSISFLLADMGDLDQVRRLAADVRKEHDRLDVLIHNAGALANEYGENASGLEQTVASQVVGPFLLTAKLLPLLSKTPGSRVITVASGGMYSESLDVSRLVMNPGNYDGTKAYAIAKRAQVALNQEWARHEGSEGITFQAMHPGWADTPGVVKSLPRFHSIMGPALRSPEEGADTIIWLATSEQALESNGKFWHDRRQRGTAYLPKTTMNPAEKARLWEWTLTQATAPAGSANSVDRSAP